MKKFNFIIISTVIFVFLMTGCSSLFGPSLKGSTPVRKALDGAKQIEKSEAADEKLIQLFNAEYVKAYEEVDLLLKEAKEDVSIYLDMTYRTFDDLATSYNSIKNKYGALITSEVSFPNLVKDLDKTASQDLYRTGTSLDKNTTDTKEIDKHVKYIKKAYELDESLKEEGIKIVNEYYIIAGDIKAKSDVNNDLSSAINYYEMVLGTDSNNSVALEKRAKVIKKQTDLKIASINELLKDDKGYDDYYQANKIFDSLNSKVQEEYSALGDLIEKKRTAVVLFCVNSKDRFNIPETKEFKPNWSMNEVDKRPKKIIVDFVNIRSSNPNISAEYNYVFIPDSNFGATEYDFDTEVSGNITVDSTRNKAEKALFETALEIDPNNEEAKQALMTGTYRKTVTNVSQEINNIYRIYKIVNGEKKEIYSASKSVVKVELEEIQYISGSKAAITKQTGATFDKGDYWGERFNRSKIEDYFSPSTTKDLYNGYINNLETYFNLF